MSAHVRADRDVCIGAGNCVMTLARVFDQDDDGVVVVLDEHPDGEDPELLQRAVVMCPSGAITVTTT
ncbi:(4Fe-4S)-binding protein [Actinoplanes sp. NPDC049316]|uniref:(4Fe-4S)-binding protein n=1 Tax=Actinoplanes sp. NPDC049316 TaxID=3154727 RepID=UPI00341D58F7